MSKETKTTGIGGFAAAVIMSPFICIGWAVATLAGEEGCDDLADEAIKTFAEFGDDIERKHGKDIASAVVQAVVMAAVGGVIGGPPPPPKS